MGKSRELRDWLILLRTPGLGPAGLRERLLAAGGEASSVVAQLQRSPGGLEPAALAWLRHPDEGRLQADLDWLAQPGRRLLRFDEADFPPQLGAIPQPPVALFVVGEAGLLLYPQVAIVGARGASASGLANARAFAVELTRAGLLVTSGLAAGIDGAAHAAALDAGAPTLAVMGTGPDGVYPRQHRALAERIAAAGALVSEFPPGTAAHPDHFPRRNRLIAGLALGTLVVEAGLHSGSLITARLAAEQGREVFALPGSIHHPLARGCHRLIRDGARLVEAPEEIVEALAPGARHLGGELAARLAEGAAPSPPTPRSDGDVAAEHERLLQALGHDPVTLDELAARTGQPAAELSSQLLMLELEGRVEGLPGNRYQRVTD